MSGTAIRTSILVVVLVALAASGSVGYWLWKPPASSGSVAELVSGLRSYQRDTRIASATALATVGLDDEAAHEALVEALSDKSESVRNVAADALSKRANPRSAKPLLGMLKDPAPTVRATAAFGLSKIPDLGPAEVELLMACTRDTDPYVRSCVFVSADVRARAATTPGDPRVTLYEPLVISAIKDQSPLVRRAVLQKLKNPPTGSLVEANTVAIATAAALEDTDVQARTIAVLAVPGVIKAAGPKLKESTVRELATKIPALIHGIVLGDSQTRPENQAAIAAISSAVKAAKINPDDELVAKTRAAYMEALATPGGTVKPLILGSLPPLVLFLKPDAKLLKEILEPTIADTDAHVAAVNTTRDVLNTLGATDDATATMAVDLLRPILKDQTAQVRATAYQALWHSPAARKVGGTALRDELRGVTKSYMKDLTEKDPNNPKAFNQDAGVREVAAWCLSWTDPEDSADALKALEAVNNDKDAVDAKVKDRVTKALEKLKAAGPPSASWPEPSWEPFRRGGGGRR